MAKTSKPAKTYGVPAKVTTPSTAPRQAHPLIGHEHAALPTSPKGFHGQLSEKPVRSK